MQKKIKFIIILTLFMTASASFAADRPVVTDHDSKPDAGRKAAVLPPLVSERYEYRDVCGCCEKDLQCDMMQKAIRWNDGNSYDSITKWKVKWDYGYKRGAESCSADSFRITLDIVIQLPKWVCTADAPQALKDRWDAYIKELLTHENGHRDIARQAAEELTRAVSRLTPARSCREVDREVHSLCRDRMDKLDQDQQNYDEATGHGFAGEPAFP